MVTIMQSSIVLLLALAAASNGVSKAANLQQEHRDISEMTYSKTNDFATALLARVNKERVAQGLPAICSNKKLQAAAQRHVKDMSKSDFISDTGTDDSTLKQRVTDAGYKWQTVEENIGSNITNADALVNLWMKSSDRANILGQYAMAGTAYAYNANTHSKQFWVQVYATGSSEKCDAA